MRGSVRRWTTWAAAGLVVGLLGCSDGVGPEGSGEMNVFLTGSGSSAEAALASLSGGASSAGELSLDDVLSIDIEVARLEAILFGEDEEEEGSWVELALSGEASQSIDLMNLPQEILIASADLAPGTYSNLRIFFESATITLLNDVTVGTQTFLASESPHPLFIPSGEQTGIKIPLFSVTVSADAETDVVIAVDEAATVNTVAATGAGLLMEPVLGQQEEQAQ